MGIDYVEIKRYFDGHSFSNQKARIYSNLLHRMEEFIDPKDIKIFYPKNLFRDDKDLEVYLIIEDKIVKGTVLDDNNIELTALRLKDLTGFKCECISNNEGVHRLTLEFENDEIVVFDNVEDTNDSWRYKFEKHIKDLAKYIIKVY